MKIVDLSIRRPVTVFIFSVAAVVFGIVAFRNLAVNLLPDISYPSITIQTDYEDAAPEEVESLLTRPVEEAVGVLRGLQTIHSVSRAGVSEVTLEFDWDTDIYLNRQIVQEKLQLARGQLPPGIEPQMAPISSIMGEITFVALTSTTDGDGPSASPGDRWIRTYSEQDLRALGDLLGQAVVHVVVHLLDQFIVR